MKKHLASLLTVLLLLGLLTACGDAPATNEPATPASTDMQTPVDDTQAEDEGRTLIVQYQQKAAEDEGFTCLRYLRFTEDKLTRSEEHFVFDSEKAATDWLQSEEHDASLQFDPAKYTQSGSHIIEIDAGCTFNGVFCMFKSYDEVRNALDADEAVINITEEK